MLLAALSSPRTPAGGWSGDPNSSLRFPLRHRIAPPPRGLAPAEKPFVWTEVIGERYGLVTKHVVPKTVPQWKLGKPPPAWWMTHCDVSRRHANKMAERASELTSRSSSRRDNEREAQQPRRGVLLTVASSLSGSSEGLSAPERKVAIEVWTETNM